MVLAGSLLELMDSWGLTFLEQPICLPQLKESRAATKASVSCFKCSRGRVKPHRRGSTKKQGNQGEPSREQICGEVSTRMHRLDIKLVVC
jgi:hypothetical protein